jgi:CelD/BcsL family acetyltransferase involved in cellulose biosynthesis
MEVYEVDPLGDPRWTEFLRHDPRASVFHTPQWLEALRRSYGYRPFVLTTSAPRQDLSNGIVLCHVNSWLTGKRMVSLPFSDHCEPLVECPHVLEEVLMSQFNQVRKGHVRYIEIRPLRSLQPENPELRPSNTYHFHTVDLRPSLDEIFHKLHKNSIQRKIRRAEREGLVYQEGNDPRLLDQFYRLFAVTRGRHGLPPSPLQWLRNLLDCFGPDAQVRIASKEGCPVAGMLTLVHGKTIVYKYGGTDTRFNPMGGMSLLFWRTIQDGKARGLEELDLGRCDADDTGLVTFKNRWGSVKSTLTYWRLGEKGTQNHLNGWPADVARRLFLYTPHPLRVKLGNFLYKHVG